MLGLFLTACPHSSPAAEVVPNPVRIGIAGQFKVGRWTQARVLLDSPAGEHLRLEVDAPDPEGSIVTYRSEPAGNRPAAARELGLLFKMGRLEGTLRVRLKDGERLVWEKNLRVAQDPDADVAAPWRQAVFLIGLVQPPNGASPPREDSRREDSRRENSPEGNSLVGRSPGGNSIDAKLLATNETASATAGTALGQRVEIARIGAFDELPLNPEAYASLDAILLAGRLDVDPGRSAAIERWVRTGGHLVVSVGKEGKEFAKSPLAAWLPVKVAGTVPLRDLAAVESFCRQSSRIMGGGDEPFESARLSVADGQVLIGSIEGPLLCRAACGLGRVTILGIDINDSRILNWPSAGELLRRIFDFEEQQSKRARPVATRLTQTGITELATQLDATQDDFPSVSRVGTWSIMALLVALLLVIGPLDFLLVHKLFRRPELTWITFPLAAAACGGAAVYWGISSKGDRLRINQIDVVDVDGATGAQTLHSYGLIFSPENQRFNVSGETEPAARVSWHGRAESSFGGMYRSGGAEIARPAYSAAPGSRSLEEVPIPVWCTKAVEAEWQTTAAGLIEDNLESRGPGHLGGTLRHHFPVPIEEWILAYGHLVFRPHDDPKTEKPRPLAPGIPWDPQSSLQRELTGYLTGATQRMEKSPKTKFDELVIEHADYDPLDRDPVRVMRMLSFHAAAGGTAYTGLSNGALRSSDLSPLLDLNRAVLVGRLSRPAMHWTVNGKPVEAESSTTLVRLVLPVRSSRRGD